MKRAKTTKQTKVQRYLVTILLAVEICVMLMAFFAGATIQIANAQIYLATSVIVLLVLLLGIYLGMRYANERKKTAAEYVEQHQSQQSHNKS